MNVRILVDSKRYLEDVSPHFETHAKCWVVVGGGLGSGGLKWGLEGGGRVLDAS